MGVVQSDPSLEYRLAWARTVPEDVYGMIVNSKRGIWTLTEKGCRGILSMDSVRY